MKVSDAIAAWLRDKGFRHVYCVSGGAVLHLIHSLAKTEGINIVCPQSEQAAGFAADASARLMGFGCALATSGPGATNLITPIAASWYDSIPTLYLTGNQTIERLKTYGTRQYGFQSTPICQIVQQVTKAALQVQHAAQAIPILEESWRIANTGRKGPVLVDLPDDVVRATV